MTSVNLFDLYRRTSESAFRLETLQQYTSPAESEQIRRFYESKSLLPSREVAKSMDTIRDLTSAGKRLYRVHVIDLPLTSYMRYEIAAYAENIKVGEDVLIAVRDWHENLRDLTEDFIMFDPETSKPSVVWMHYNEQGQVIGREYSDQPEDLILAYRYRDIAMMHAIPLNDFTSLAEAG